MRNGARYHDVEGQHLALALYPGRDVHGIPYDRVIEPEFRPHVSDERSPRIDADADGNVWQRYGALPEAEHVVGVEVAQTLADTQCSPAGARRVVRSRERSVPERHERIADVFVDGAAFREDVAGQSAKQQIEKVHHLGWRQLFAHRGEVPDIEEENRDFALFAPKSQASWVALD